MAGEFTNTVTARVGNIQKSADFTVETEDPNGHLTITNVVTSIPASGTGYALGEEIHYKITVTNNGNLTITNINVEDEVT